MNTGHETSSDVDAVGSSVSDELAQLLAAPIPTAVSARDRPQMAGVVIGTLLGFADGGAIPLVSYGGQPGTAALPASTTVDLYGPEIGRPIVLMFNEGDPCRPIILGCLRDAGTRTVPPVPEHVEIDADGRRLVVSARERIVLRCGKASITLTKEGKVILQGEYVSSQSSGVLRIKGGSVQIN